MKKSRGRPLGFKLSEASKKAISESKKGQRHSEATKNKISKTLLRYFRHMYPLSEELHTEYLDLITSNQDIKEWFDDIKQLYDESDGIYTEKSLNSKRYREVSIEYNINMEDNPHTKFACSPETLFDIKNDCKKLGLDFREVCYHLGLELHD